MRESNEEYEKLRNLKMPLDSHDPFGNLVQLFQDGDGHFESCLPCLSDSLSVSVEAWITTLWVKSDDIVL